MARGTTSEVGAAFRAGRELQGNGSIRSECRGGLTIGYSYAEPVAITDGRDTLRTIAQWSVTTSAHVGAFGCVGRLLPADTDTLRRVARGDMRAFGEAVAHGEAALMRATERVRAKGAPVVAHDGAYRLGDGCLIRREDAGRWYLYRDGVIVSDHRTLREARVAAWDVVTATPRASHWDVEYTDLRPA